jgi:hypothetical protein
MICVWFDVVDGVLYLEKTICLSHTYSASSPLLPSPHSSQFRPTPIIAVAVHRSTKPGQHACQLVRTACATMPPRARPTRWNWTAQTASATLRSPARQDQIPCCNAVTQVLVQPPTQSRALAVATWLN